MSGRGERRGRHYSDGHSNPSNGGGGRGCGRGSSGAVTPSPTQTQSTPAYSTPPASSISALAASSLSKEMEQKLTLESTTTIALPASSKEVRAPMRRVFGTVGKKIQVRANHFMVHVADRDLHHSDVTIRPEITSKKIHKDVINLHLYFEKHLGRRIPAYDGMKSLYTAGPLPFSSREFVVKLVSNDGGSSSSKSKKDRDFKVALAHTLANKPDIYRLQQFLRSRSVETPQEEIQVLDVARRASPSEKYNVVGRSFFSTELG